MGQRVALLLSQLLLLTASRTLVAVSFPEDSVPLAVVDEHCEDARKRTNRHNFHCTTGEGTSSGAEWTQCF